MIPLWTLWTTASLLAACGGAKTTQPTVVTVHEDPVAAMRFVADDLPSDPVDSDVLSHNLPRGPIEPYAAYGQRRGQPAAHYQRWADAGALDPDPVASEGIAAIHRRSNAGSDRATRYLDSRGGAVGSDAYTVRVGDTAASIAASMGDLPVWLVEVFNPDTDLAGLTPGQRLILPIPVDAIDLAVPRAPRPSGTLEGGSEGPQGAAPLSLE